MLEEHWPFYRKLPVSMPKKEAEELARLLKELRDYAKLENAAISDDTKEEMELYLRTWIVKPLEAMVERYNSILPEHAKQDLKS